MCKLSFEHNFPHQTARRTQLQEDIRLCFNSQTKDQGIDTAGDMSHEWITWLETQPKEAFKCVRTYHSPVSDKHRILVECPSCGQRVSGGRGFEIHQQKSCRERKTQRDQEKHNQERLRERTGKTGRICEACHAAFTRKDAWQRHVMSLCAAISDTSPPDHPLPETSNVRERDEQERTEGRQGTTRRGSRGRGAAGQDDRPPDASARIRTHGNGESRERRVRIRCRQRHNASHGSQQRSIRSRGRGSQEDQRRSVQGAPRRKRNQTQCSGCWRFDWQHWWRNRRKNWMELWEP